MSVFSNLFSKWSEKNASKKIGQAIETGNEKMLHSFLTRKPQTFNYVLWGNHPDNPRNDKTPLAVFGNPIKLAQYVGRPHLIPILEQAGYINPDKPTTPQNKLGS